MMPAVIYAPLPMMRQGLFEWVLESRAAPCTIISDTSDISESNEASLLVAGFGDKVPEKDLRLIRRLLQQPNWAVILLLPIGEIRSAGEKLLRLGLNALLPNTAGRFELSRALQSVFEGKVWVEPEVSHILVSNWHASAPTKISPAGKSISQREREILRLIVSEELTNEQIADRLFISKRTVDTHRQNLLRKTGVRNTVGLVKYALKHPQMNTSR